MVSSACQTALRIFNRNIVEIQFSLLFISSVIVNKYIFSRLGFSQPTVLQGWNTLTCVLILSPLIKFQKVTDDVKILDKRSFTLMLPAFICFAVSIVAGSKGLSEMSVPVYCAILSLYPAILVLTEKKTDFQDNSKRVCGSAAICGTVVVIIVMTSNTWTLKGYLWLFVHVILSIIYTLYVERVHVDLSDTAKIYYRNCFSVIFLFPISIYLDALFVPTGFTWKFYFGCILSGILGTFLQMVTSKIEKKASYMNCQGRAKIICILISHYMFFANTEPIIWFVILINLLINSFILSPDLENLEDVKKSKLTFITGPIPRRDVERLISV